MEKSCSNRGTWRGRRELFDNALEADPQLQEARLNLARIPFKQGDYGSARKELESLLAASSGGKRQSRREQLIRYQIFLTLLRENREGAAQKAMEDFKMTDESPALYYAQAAWAYQHGNPTQGDDWIANANNLFSAEMNRDFVRPLKDLGWSLNRNESRKNEPTENEAETKSKSVVTPSSTAPPAVVSQEASPNNGAVESAPPAPAPSPKEHPSTSPLSENLAPSSSPKAKPEKSAKKPARGETESSPEKRERTEPPATNQSARAKTAGKVSRPETRESQNRGAASAMPSSQPTTLGAPAPTSAIHENLGDKFRNLVLYPFHHREKTTPKSGPPRSAGAPGPTASPIPR